MYIYIYILYIYIYIYLSRLSLQFNKSDEDSACKQEYIMHSCLQALSSSDLLNC